jgi:hypothetical protein
MVITGFPVIAPDDAGHVDRQREPDLFLRAVNQFLEQYSSHLQRRCAVDGVRDERGLSVMTGHVSGVGRCLNGLMRFIGFSRSNAPMQ